MSDRVIHADLAHTEDDDPMLLDPATALDLLAGAPWRRFAAMGDSVALGVGDASPGYRDIGWSDRFAETLRAVRPDLAYLNTGRIGATCAQVLDEQLRTVLDFRPDLVHICCGGNDLFRRGGVEHLPAQLDSLFGAVARSGAQIFAFTLADVWETERMAAMRPLRDRMAGLNDMVREVAIRYDALLVDFWDHPLRLRPEVMSADLIHFTTSGHAVVTSEVILALGGLISDDAPRTDS